MQRKIISEKEKEENIKEKENILFAEERKNGVGKGGKYLEKENIFCAEEKE